MVSFLHSSLFSDFWLLLAAVFILGTYVVSTLDDILHMSASKSFAYIWAALATGLAAALFFVDAKDLVIRIVIAAAIIAISLSKIAYFKLAHGDLYALMPVIFLFPLLYVLLFIIFVIIVDKAIFSPYYTKLRKKSEYPFMPAILTGVIITLVLFYLFSFTAIVSGIRLFPEKNNTAVEVAKNTTTAGPFAWFTNIWHRNTTTNATSTTVVTGTTGQQPTPPNPEDIKDNPLS